MIYWGASQPVGKVRVNAAFNALQKAWSKGLKSGVLGGISSASMKEGGNFVSND